MRIQHSFFLLREWIFGEKVISLKGFIEKIMRRSFTEVPIRLNIGCGNDYREGFINIDGRADLPRVDWVINLSKESLLKYFEE